MDLNEARNRANTQLKFYGLSDKGWFFEFDRATSRLGQTNYAKRRITISKHFTGAATSEEFEQVLIHEMAHALLPVSEGHGRLWKMKAASLGYTGGRTGNNPYQEQQRLARPATGRVGLPAPSLHPLVAAAEATTTKLRKGAELMLPHGVKLTVQTINGNRTTAAEDSGDVWTLSTLDAERFLL